MRLNKQLFGWLGASALLLTACTANDNLELKPQDENVDMTQVYGKGSKIVSLTLNADGAAGTRADGVSHISDGTQVDILKFAIYEKSGNDWVIAKEFQKSTDKTFTSAAGKTVAVGEGQNIIDAKLNNYPITIKLALDEEKEYKIACWAQYSGSDVFFTEDLEKVRVRYNSPVASDEIDGGFAGPDNEIFVVSPKNNDEFRDAFCASQEISQDANEVIMHRPFAQINVGTTLADYNNIMNGKIITPNKRLKYSKIVVAGAAKFIDVLADEILKDGDLSKYGIEDSKATTTVTYDFAPIPAYYTLNNVIPTSKEDILYKEGEELLKVKLNDDKLTSVGYWTTGGFETVEKGDVFFPYKKNYPTIKSYKEDLIEEWEQIENDEFEALIAAGWDFKSFKDDTNEIKDAVPNHTVAFKEGSLDTYKYVENGGLKLNENSGYTASEEKPSTIYLTEEFKYMSMCYVLVPTKRKVEDNTGTVTYTGSILGNVKVYFAETADGNDLMADNSPYKATTKISIDNVPVNRNWRTNILAGLYDTDEPDPDDPTPDGPDDPTSLVKTTKLCIHLCPIFTNETNGFYNQSSTSWSNALEEGGFDWTGSFPTGTGSWHDYFENNHK